MTTRSSEIMQRARWLFPGGVSSPVRAFKAVGGTPVFVDHAEGPYLYGADGTRYVYTKVDPPIVNPRDYVVKVQTPRTISADGTGVLLLPVLGPWIMLGTKAARDTTCDGTDDLCVSSRAPLRAILVLDGIVQAGGAAMFLAGFLVPRKRLVRRDVVVGLLPMKVGEAGYGVGVAGTF